MILPLGDSPNPRGIPAVNYALIIANVAVFLLITVPLSTRPVDPADPAVVEYLRVVPQENDGRVSAQEMLERMTAYDLFVYEHGFRPVQPRFDDLFASLFLHAGFVHLFGNMLVLWIYGDNVEHRLGPIGYLFAYLTTGVAATLVHLTFASDSALPLIGASGAISGMLGFYFRWFPHNKVRLLVFLFPLLMDVFIIPARVVLGFYLFADNLVPFLLSNSNGGGVAYGAHVGGFVGGMIVAWLLDRHATNRQPHDLGAAPAPAPAATISLDEMIDGGELEEAAQRYFALPAHATRHVLSPPQALALATWLRRSGHAESALTVFRRILRDSRSGPHRAAAHLGAGLVLLEDLRQSTPAYQHLLDALDAQPSPEVAAQARAALRVIIAQQKFQIGRERGAGW